MNILRSYLDERMMSLISRLELQISLERPVVPLDVGSFSSSCLCRGLSAVGSVKLQFA